MAGIARGGKVIWRRLDVDADAELLRLYGNEVPVLLVNGRKAFKYRVTPGELQRRVRAEQRRASARGWLGRWRTSAQE